MIKPNYEDSITNLACSIRKYFGLSTRHNGIKDIDTLLDDKKPRNVVVILYDGLGFNIMNRHLDKDSFLVRNCIRDYSSVVPCTTTASTTSMLTGMNPCEHGWLGWDLYIKPEDMIVTMFTNKIKDTSIDAKDYNVVRRYYDYNTITDDINNDGKYSSKILFPFGNGAYYGLKDMHNRILEECRKDGKHYVYAYYEDPDGTMHEYGTYERKEENNIIIRKLGTKLFLFSIISFINIDNKKIYLKDIVDYEIQ